MTTTMKRLGISSIPPAPKKRRLSSSSSVQLSAEIIGGHDYLLTEILLLLPAKSLLRFKSVSKHWESLISSKSFSRRHCLRPETQHSFILGIQGRSQFFICHPAIKKLARFSLPCNFPFIHEQVKILQSCHGLLLLDCGYKEKGKRYYFVLNPITKQFQNIRTGNAACSISLIFDPSKSEYYKVIGIWRHSRNVLSFSIYRSDTREWRSSSYVIVLYGLKKFSGLCCNNRAYFIRDYDTSLYYCRDDMRRVPSPPKNWGRTGYIVESNGHLHCIGLTFKENKPRFCISEMIRNKWLAGKKTDWYQLKPVLKEQKRSTRGQIEFLGMIREERLEDSMVLVHVPGQILISRFSDEACQVLVDYRDNDLFYQEGRLQFKFQDAHPFIGSFASV